MGIIDLNKRAIDIFRVLVDEYVESGEPVGSRTLSRRLDNQLSPATVRNIMADLEDAGLLCAPHTSAGRFPTDKGWRFFVDSLLTMNELTEKDRLLLDQQYNISGESLDNLLEKATQTLSGIAKCTSLVFAPKRDLKLKTVEFIPVSSQRALLILISEDGDIENRIIDIPEGTQTGALEAASDFLKQHAYGRTLKELKLHIEALSKGERSRLDELSNKLIESGIGQWTKDGNSKALLIKGQAHLLENISDLGDLDNIRSLLQTLDTKEHICNLLQASIHGEGVQIFIGAEDELFDLSGCSMVVSPYNNKEHVLGTIGIIGPKRMDYSRIIPMVDYTAKLVSRLIKDYME